MRGVKYSGNDIFEKPQHGIHVKGRLPSMLKATMQVAAGTSIEIVFAAEASLTWGVWRLEH